MNRSSPMASETPWASIGSRGRTISGSATMDGTCWAMSDRRTPSTMPRRLVYTSGSRSAMPAISRTLRSPRVRAASSAHRLRSSGPMSPRSGWHSILARCSRPSTAIRFSSPSTARGIARRKPGTPDTGSPSCTWTADPAVRYETFAQGWLGDDNQSWGRQADVLVMPDGALLVSDDTLGVIYRISYAG